MFHKAASRNRLEAISCLRNIFNPSFWKAVRRTERKSARRWTRPMLALAWLGISLGEQRTLSDRFNYATKWLSGCFGKRRRPGATYQGFIDASRTSAAALIAPMREKLREIGAQNMKLEKTVRPVFSIDGTKIRVPHTQKNAASFGLTKVKDRTESGPQLMVVAAVELHSRTLWDWRIADGKAGESGLAMKIIEQLPPGALIVKDSGPVSHGWLKQLFDDGRHILMRVGGNFHLWARKVGAVLTEGGVVWLWPERNRNHAPLKLRLIKRTLNSKNRRHPKSVYLLTDLKCHELPDKEAGRLYYKRWGASEIGFRGLKQTLEKRALLSRTPEMALIECDYALLGMQFLCVIQSCVKQEEDRLTSLARTWRTWRDAMHGIARKRFPQLLAACVIRPDKRRSGKSRRRAPQKKRDYVLLPPKLRKLTNTVIFQWRQDFPCVVPENI